MTLETYIEQERKRRQKTAKQGEQIFKTDLLKELAERSGVSLLTLQKITRGELLKLYPKAKLISEATGGKVTISELLG